MSTSPVVVASHPRSGTHLLIDVLRRQFEACATWKWPGERLDRLYCNIDELGGKDDILDENTARQILQRADRPPVKTHAWPGYQTTFLEGHHDRLPSGWVQWLEERGTTLYVYRDGRDVLCSYQLFRQKYDPEADCSIGAFLRQEEDGENRVRQWARHVRAWRRQPDVHSVQFERLLDAPSVVLTELAEVLGLEPDRRTPILPQPFRTIWESRWARLAQMCPESTAIINGDRQQWWDGFTEEDRRFFHREAGGLLVELGYESTDAWAQAD
jgi:hypothetical protein